MRNTRDIILPLLCLALFMGTAQAQKFKWGIQAGINTTDVDADALIIRDESDQQALELQVKDAQYGFVFGGFAHLQAGAFFVRPELLLHSTRTDYQLEDLRSGMPFFETVTESYNSLNLPVNVGLKFGPIRFQGGMAAAFTISNDSDIEDLYGEEYQSHFDNLTLGWQAGLGVDVWKLSFDFRFQGNLDRYADHMSFFGQDVQFDERGQRLILQIGWYFK